MTDELHRIGTKAFLNALGGSCRHRVGRYEGLRPNVSGLLLGLLKLRGDRLTAKEMMVEYVYGWREDGGPSANSLEVMICHYRKCQPSAPILSAGYGRGYKLSPWQQPPTVSRD